MRSKATVPFDAVHGSCYVQSHGSAPNQPAIRAAIAGPQVIDPRLQTTESQQPNVVTSTQGVERTASNTIVLINPRNINNHFWIPLLIQEAQLLDVVQMCSVDVNCLSIELRKLRQVDVDAFRF